jgi:hypothetical protein
MSPRGIPLPVPVENITFESPPLEWPEVEFELELDHSSCFKRFLKDCYAWNSFQFAIHHLTWRDFRWWEYIFQFVVACMFYSSFLVFIVIHLIWLTYHKYSLFMYNEPYLCGEWWPCKYVKT